MLVSQILYIKTMRGGQITFHGPGQIVGYPILSLRELDITAREYICRLEKMLLDTCLSYKLKDLHMNSDTGVWIGKDPEALRKIAQIGVRGIFFRLLIAV